MKKTLIILLTLLGIGLTYLAIVGSKVQQIKTEIDILAPPSKVWSIIIDID